MCCCYLAYLLLLSISFAAWNAKTRDVIVLGCGSAGATLAAEISANPNVKVTCIDSAQDDTNYYNTNVGFNGELPPAFTSSVDFISTRETSLSGRSQKAIVPRTLGGGTTVNGNAFQRPSVYDFSTFGSSIWEYDNVLQDMKDLENSLDNSDASQHGFDGPIKVSFPTVNILTRLPHFPWLLVKL